MSERSPDEPPTDEAEPPKMVFQQWLRIAVVIAGLVLLAVALLQLTGLVDLLGPIVDTEAGQWGVFVLLAAVVGAVAVWAWRYW